MLWLQAHRPIQGDIVFEAMKRLGTPLTRQQYLLIAGLEEPLGAEVECMLPREFQLNPGPLT